MRAEARQPKLIINFAVDQKQIRLDMTLSPIGPGAAQRGDRPVVYQAEGQTPVRLIHCLALFAAWCREAPWIRA